MARTVLTSFLLLAGLMWGFAQDPCGQRTPEEEAKKQTEMMRRELNLTNQQCDSIYVLQLYYATQRRISNTRAQALQRLNEMAQKLQHILTREQYDLYMNKQVGAAKRQVVLKPQLVRDNDSTKSSK